MKITLQKTVLGIIAFPIAIFVATVLIPFHWVKDILEIWEESFDKMKRKSS